MTDTFLNFNYFGTLPFRESDKKARDLADAQRTIEEFLRQERNEQQQDRKRKKNGDLE